MKRVAGSVDGVAEEGPTITSRLCCFSFHYSKIDFIEYTKAVIQDRVAADQMIELKVHVNNIVLECSQVYQPITLCKQLKYVKLSFKESAAISEDTTLLNKVNCWKTIRDLRNPCRSRLGNCR